MKPEKPITRKEMYLDVATGGSTELPSPVTLEEIYLAKIAGMSVDLPTPLPLKHKFLAKIAGMQIDVPTYTTDLPRIYAYLAKAAGQDVEIPQPVIREEMYWFDYCGGTPTPPEREYTGAVPVTFVADGTSLLDYLISGNTVQNGTPTPDNPIMPEGCGDRTGNLCPDTGWRSGQYRDGVWETTNTRSTSDFFPVSSNQYRLKINAGQLISFINFNYFDNQKQWLGNRTTLGMSTFSPTAQNVVIPQLPSNAAYMSITIRFYNDNGNPPIPQSFIDDSKIMVSEGTSEPSYKPYGYKIPISSNSTTTPVYLGQVSTVRRIKCVDLGTLTYTKTGSGNFSATLGDGKIVGNSEIAPAICSHFKVVSANNYATTPHSLCAAINAQSVVSINKTGFEEMTVGEFKSAMSGVLLWYALQTEQTGIVNEPLMKIGDYADTLSKAQAGVSIPTADGSTTLDVETTVPPSEIYIKYRGEAVATLSTLSAEVSSPEETPEEADPEETEEEENGSENVSLQHKPEAIE